MSLEQYAFGVAVRYPAKRCYTPADFRHALRDVNKRFSGQSEQALEGNQMGRRAGYSKAEDKLHWLSKRSSSGLILKPRPPTLLLNSSMSAEGR